MLPKSHGTGAGRKQKSGDFYELLIFIVFDEGNLKKRHSTNTKLGRTEEPTSLRNK